MRSIPPLIGAHMSIAGGLHLALERGASLECTAVQLFTGNPVRWEEREADERQYALFAAGLSRHGIRLVFSHAGYLINLASPDIILREKSVTALIREVERCRRLGLPYTILHPGCHGGDGEKAGLERIASGLRMVMDASAGAPVKILLETTAGQGTSLGYRFGQLAHLLREGGPAERLGICFDTAHVFAAGYDLRDQSAYRHTMRRLAGEVGLERVLAIHVNDAKKPLGSRVDRHEQIGRGRIGLECFRLIMNDGRFRMVPKILETPKYLGKVFMDSVNLGILRKLAAKKGDRFILREKGTDN